MSKKYKIHLFFYSSSLAQSISQKRGCKNIRPSDASRGKLNCIFINLNDRNVNVELAGAIRRNVSQKLFHENVSD